MSQFAQKKSSVLVTGAAGFIGRHVAKACSQAGHRVFGIGRKSNDHWNPKEWGISHWYEGEIEPSRVESVSGSVSAIIHCAGTGSVGEAQKDPVGATTRSLGALGTMLEFASKQSKCSFLYLSSASIYGATSDMLEVSPENPISHYGLNHVLAERTCRFYWEQFKLPVTVLRLFSVYGSPARKQLLWDACGKLSEGKAKFFGTGYEIRDWLHVKDVARLCSLVMEKSARDFRVLNGGSGKGSTVKQIIEKLAVELDYAKEIKFVGEALPGYPVAQVADVSEIARLGFIPEISLADGIREYANWFKTTQESRFYLRAG